MPCSKLARKFAVALALIFASQAHAKTLVIPYPGLIEQEGLLQPSVLLGKPGFTLETLASAGRLPSKFSLAGAFPLFKGDTLRASGWMWAIRAGLTGFSYQEDSVFAAGHYYFEAGLGRGTAVPFFEGRSGIRGYMEVSFRNERPKLNREVDEISKRINRAIRDHKTFVSLKIGAGSALDADGLVRQKPGTWGHRVQTQVYLPMTESGGSIINAMVQGYTTCPSLTWLCGWHLSYQHHYETSSGDSYDELSDLVGAGVFVNFYRREDYNISSRLTWPFIGNASRKGFEKAPILHVHLTKSF